MADDRELYLAMMRETEKDIRILIEVRKKCEELYIRAPEPEIIVLPGVNDRPTE